MTPEELYNLASSGSKLTYQQECIIASEPQWSYSYALGVLKSRFELGEEIISSCAGYSFAYALDVLKSRFELGEAIIATDHTYAHLYAINVVKGRFELGEDVMLKNANSAYLYVYYCNVPFEFISRILDSSLRNSFLRLYFRDYT